MINMYAVKCLYKWEVYNKEKAMYEERLILIKSNSLDDADKKSEKYALDYEDEFVNVHGDIVKIKLFQILDIYEVFNTNSRTNIEVYSNLFKATDKQINDYMEITHPLEEKKIDKDYLNIDFNKPELRNK